jgi:hypothetical protein
MHPRVPRPRRTPVARLALLAASLVAAVALPALGANAQFTLRTASGLTAADITAARDQFRLDLGGGNVAGPDGLFADATGARREIDWDGVPAALSAPNLMPADLFQARGTIYATPGTGLQVSGGPGALPLDEFRNIDPSYPATFAPFSPSRLFTPVGSNVIEIHFVLPGTTTPGATRGFGAVFADADDAGTTGIQFFDVHGVSLVGLAVPAAEGVETFSFFGLSFPDPRIGRVRIRLGNAALGAGVVDDPVPGGTDVVVLDDFIFGEVQAVPEPSAWTLLAAGLAAGLAALGAAARRRARA